MTCLRPSPARSRLSRGKRGDGDRETAAWIPVSLPRLCLIACYLITICSTTPVKAQTCLPPPPGLVGWWSGDDTYRNLVPGGQNGHGVDHLAFRDGKVGRAFWADGGSCVDVPDSPELDAPTFTIDAWINVTELPPESPSLMREGTLLSKLGHPAWEGWRFDLIRNPGAGGAYISLWLFHWPDHKQAVANSRIALFSKTWNADPVHQADPWVHVAASYDGNTARVYINGVETGSALLPGGYTPATPPDGKHSTNLRIGAANWRNEKNNWTFHGFIDEVHFFNRALAAEEVKAIYDAGSAGLCKPQDAETAAPGTELSLVAQDITALGQSLRRWMLHW